MIGTSAGRSTPAASQASAWRRWLVRSRSTDSMGDARYGKPRPPACASAFGPKAATQTGGMRLLDRQGRQHDLAFAAGDRVSLPSAHHRCQAPLEDSPLVPTRHFEGVEHGRLVAATDAEGDPTAGQPVQNGDLLRSLERMAQGEQVGRRGEADGPRSCRHRGEEHQRIGDRRVPGEVVLGQPERLISPVLGQFRLVRQGVGIHPTRYPPRRQAKVQRLTGNRRTPWAAPAEG